MGNAWFKSYVKYRFNVNLGNGKSQNYHLKFKTSQKEIKYDINYGSYINMDDGHNILTFTDDKGEEWQFMADDISNVSHGGAKRKNKLTKRAVKKRRSKTTRR